MISVYTQVSSSAINWETIINLKKCNEAILSKFQERRKAKFRKQLVNIEKFEQINSNENQFIKCVILAPPRES